MIWVIYRWMQLTKHCQMTVLLSYPKNCKGGAFKPPYGGYMKPQA